MEAKGYLGQAAFRAHVLPGRAAFLFRAGSRDGFRRAVQEASTRWGGVTEPIIPVGSKGLGEGWFRQVVEISRVDALVNVDLTDAQATTVAQSFDLPLVPLAHIDRSGPTRWSTHPAMLADDQISGYDSLVVPGENAALWQITAVGDLTAEHVLDAATSGIPVRRERLPDQVARAHLFKAGLLDATCRQFGTRYASGGGWTAPTVLWVIPRDGRSALTDCVLFWNFRALRGVGLMEQPMFLLPEAEVQDWLGFPEQVASLLVRPDEFAPDVVLVSETLKAASLDAMAHLLGLVPAPDRKVRSSHRWPAPPDRTPPFTFLAGVDPRGSVVFEREYGRTANPTVQLFRVGTEVRFASPVACDTYGGGTLIRFESSAFAGLPRREAVAELIEPNASWVRGALQLASHTQPEYVFTLNLPSLGDALQAVVGRVVTSHGLSDKGRVGTALMQGLAPEDIQTPALYGVVDALATPRSKELTRELQKHADKPEAAILKIAHEWGGRANRRHRTATATGVHQADEALERLCSLGWAERGFVLDCSSCGLNNFVMLNEVDGEAVCPACTAPGRFRATLGPPDVTYRLNALVDRGQDQGVIAHLLVWAWLRRRDPQTYLLPGVNVVSKTGRKFEVDVLGLHQGQLFAGEVKTSPSDFTDEQIDRDMQASTDLGADLHIVACVGALSRKTVSRAQAAASAAGLDLLAIHGSGLLSGD